MSVKRKVWIGCMACMIGCFPVSAQPRIEPADLPILAWHGIPAHEATVERFEELRDAGFTLNFRSFPSADAVAKGLDAAEKAGIKLIIGCPELEKEPEKTVRRFMNHSALAGYFLRDEPRSNEFAELGEWARRTTALEVPAGQYLSMELQDGTKVWLNSASSVEYVAPFFSRERRVKMDGEAYFEVQHDAQAPFVVSTNGLDIKVLGTRFNIRNDDSDHRITTVLLEGAVKAYASGDEKAAVRLRPSQQLVFDTRTGAMRLTDEPSADRSINWIDGRFCFEHDTFGEIVAELKRYYNVDIRFMDTRLRDMRFSGNFRVEDGIYHIMSVLQLTYKFNYRIAGNDIELYANPER